jgi:hypothetical protein
MSTLTTLATMVRPTGLHSPKQFSNSPTRCCPISGFGQASVKARRYCAGASGSPLRGERSARTDKIRTVPDPASATRARHIFLACMPSHADCHVSSQRGQSALGTLLHCPVADPRRLFTKTSAIYKIDGLALFLLWMLENALSDIHIVRRRYTEVQWLFGKRHHRPQLLPINPGARLKVGHPRTATCRRGVH